MKKLRLALSKGEELRFLSHLDLAQAVERTIKRAEIKMAYSQGFNPHMKISFSSALALGITASAEYMDMDIEDDLTLEEVIKRFNENSPKGLKVLDGVEIIGKTKKMMAICNYAKYVVEGTATKEVNWQETLASFNDAEDIQYEKITPKRRKMINLKEFVKEPITAEVDGDKVKLHISIGIYPTGTVKPSEVWMFGKEQLGWPVLDDYAIHREAILIEKEDGVITPLEV